MREPLATMIFPGGSREGYVAEIIGNVMSGVEGGRMKARHQCGFAEIGVEAVEIVARVGGAVPSALKRAASLKQGDPGHTAPQTTSHPP